MMLCSAIACERLYADAVNSGPELACHRVAPLCLADIESLDQSLLDSKYMTGHFIREETAVKVAHHRMTSITTSPSSPLVNPTGSTCGSMIAHWRVQYA
jgi:hypothetical protein